MEISAFDDIMKLNYDEDMSLFEWFMDGEERSSAALAYSLSADPVSGEGDIRGRDDDDRGTGESGRRGGDGLPFEPLPDLPDGSGSGPDK